jgi:hypothetical protein
MKQCYVLGFFLLFDNWVHEVLKSDVIKLILKTEKWFVLAGTTQRSNAERPVVP